MLSVIDKAKKLLNKIHLYSFTPTVRLNGLGKIFPYISACLSVTWQFYAFRPVSALFPVLYWTLKSYIPKIKSINAKNKMKNARNKTENRPNCRRNPQIGKQDWQVQVTKLDRHKEKSPATSGAETNTSESMKEFRIQPDPDPDSQHWKNTKAT